VYFPTVDLIARPILVLFDAFAPDLLLHFSRALAVLCLELLPVRGSLQERFEWSLRQFLGSNAKTCLPIRATLN